MKNRGRSSRPRATSTSIQREKGVFHSSETNSVKFLLPPLTAQTAQYPGPSHTACFKNMQSIQTGRQRLPG